MRLQCYSLVVGFTVVVLSIGRIIVLVPVPLAIVIGATELVLVVDDEVRPCRAFGCGSAAAPTAGRAIRSVDNNIVV